MTTHTDSVRMVSIEELMEHPREAIKSLQFRWIKREGEDREVVFESARLIDVSIYNVSLIYRCLLHALQGMGAVRNKGLRQRLEFEVVSQSGMRVIIDGVQQLEYICCHSWRMRPHKVRVRPRVGPRLASLVRPDFGSLGSEAQALQLTVETLSV